MNEIQAILRVFEESQRKKETSYLATIVNTKGSTYRRPGARMLMTSAGQIVGAISGGCLENDVFEHTRQKMRSGEAIVVTYDTTGAEDIVWGLGIGCNGIVQVLIERLDRPLNPLAFLRECFDKRQLGVMATVVRVEGSVEIAIAARLMLALDGSIMTDIEEPDLLQNLIRDAKAALDDRRSSIHQYQLPFGSIEVFIEVIQPPTPLIIFGAGSDAIPVVQFAKALGWHVTVVDCRANEATRDRFALADRTILTRRERLPQLHSLTEELSAAVVMTHNYLEDLEVLRTVLPSTIPYVGILGPKRRTERLLQELQTTETYSNTQLEKLHAPIGLDIGGDTPAAIAISIVTEIQVVLAQRTGGFLKHRSLPIHE
jgi:xanthine dehydrogenase accessory factor